MKPFQNIISLLLIIVGGYLLIVLSPPQYISDILGGNKVYMKNRLILLQKSKEVKIVYFDKDKNKLELTYDVKVGEDNEPTIVNKEKYNFFNFFSYNDKLLYIELLKRNSNIEKEFEENLNQNGYVGYYDKEKNNLYIFAHNGTKGINGGRIFYDLKKGDKIEFINSMLNLKKDKIVRDRVVLPKKKFIDEFVNNEGIFNMKGQIYLITCYPNYHSTQRLIIRLN